jgi:hypothetical protein
LATDPSQLYDMPLNHPAPLQLTGSEHLLSTQLAFAPVFWSTGNAVLAASVATFLAYPLAATAMYWLACVLGCGRSVAVVAGLALALGAGQTPAHFHLLQVLVLYLPLVAGTITRLREEPTLARALAGGVVCLLAFFSSYYTAVLAAFVVAVWIAAEACRPLPARGRFLVRASLAALVPALLLGAFSLPWAQRPEAAAVLSSAGSPTYDAGVAAQARFYSATAGPLLRLLAVAGLIGLAAAPPARTLASRGLLLAVVGGVLMLGPSQRIGDVTVPLPFGWLAATPLKFVRYPTRFLGLVVFGRALLVAGGLETVRRLLPRRLGAVLAIGLAVVVARRAFLIPGNRLDHVTSVELPIYDVVARKARELGDGPLLEMPVLLQMEHKRLTDADAMIGATRHWQPLVTGHTGYSPPHRQLVDFLLRWLPAPEAAQTLVDVTHVRWLLLRPLAEWPPAMAPQRTRLATAPWARQVAGLDGWLLLQVTLPPQHDSYFTAVADGWRPGSTALGTPVAPIADGAAQAEVTGQLPAAMPSGAARWIDVVVKNLGDAAWPVSVPTFGELFTPPYDGEVFLQLTWRADDDPASEPTVSLSQLAHDVAAHESVRQRLVLRSPSVPGRYDVELAVRQRNGEGFVEPPSRFLRGIIEVH